MCLHGDKMATKTRNMCSVKSPQIPEIHDNPVVPLVIPTLTVLG